MGQIDLASGIALYLILVISIGVHEFAHAWAADKLGDDLPRSQGRVTLNPIAHMDPIGTGLIPLLMIFLPTSIAIIGWGKPVMINPSNFNPKTQTRDHLLSVAAGPASNVLIMLIVAILGGILVSVVPDPEPLAQLIIQMLAVNAILTIFNLMPIPPLDGSHFLRYAIGMKEETYYQFAQYGWIILLVLVNLPPFRVLLGFLMNVLMTPFLILWNLIASLLS